MEILLFTIDDTEVSLLSGGKVLSLFQSKTMSAYQLPLSLEKDKNVFRASNLCFLSWELQDQRFSIPLLKGMVFTLKENGFLLMLDPENIYFVKTVSLSQEMIQRFYETLKEITSMTEDYSRAGLNQKLRYLQRQEMAQSEEMIDKVGDAIEKTGDVIADAIITAATYAGKGIVLGKDKLIEVTEKGTNVEVDERIQKGFHIAAEGSRITAKVTISVIESAAKLLANGGIWVYNQLSKNKEPSEGAKKTAKIAMKTAKSVSNVFEGVTDGAGIVLTNLSQGAVEFAQHKYGDDVAGVTDKGLQTVAHTTRVVTSVSGMKSVTGIATVVGARTGRQVMENNQKKNEAESEGISSSSSTNLPSKIMENSNWDSNPPIYDDENNNPPNYEDEDHFYDTNQESETTNSQSTSQTSQTNINIDNDISDQNQTNSEDLKPKD